MGLILAWTCVALLARFLERSWWSPGSFLALTFWVSAVGTVTMAPEYYLSFTANFYLMTLTLLASYGAGLGRLSGRRDPRAIAFELRNPRALFFFGLLFSLVSFVLTLKVIGVGIGDIASPRGILRAAQAATYRRYTEGLSFPILYNFSNAFLLAYAMASVLVFVERGKVVWRYLIPIGIFIATNMLITTRAPILFLLLLMMFSGVFAAFLRYGKGQLPPLISSKTLRYFAMVAVFIALIFFVFQVLRFGENSNRSAGEVWAHLRRWPWGSLPGFSLWFDGLGSSIAPRVPGSYTFMGIYDNLGIEERQVGGFGDYLYLTATEAANIYTAFRGMVHDFGWIGAGLFMALIGYLGGLATSTSALSAPSRLAIYVAVMGFVSFAFVVSHWAFTANLVALVVFPFLVRATFDSRQIEDVNEEVEHAL